jgi:hypothetical protein
MRLASASITVLMSRLLRAAIDDRRLRITIQSTGRWPCIDLIWRCFHTASA